MVIFVAADVLAAVKAGKVDYGKEANNNSNNQPQERRNMILKSIIDAGIDVKECNPESLSLAKDAHSSEMIDFLSTAYERWIEEGKNAKFECLENLTGFVPFFTLRAPLESGASVYHEIAVYGNDTWTPITASTVSELEGDMGVIYAAVWSLLEPGNKTGAAYALVTHPGHHSAPDHYGGYCFLNNAVIAAQLLSKGGLSPFILDVDYHAGDGTWHFAREGLIEIDSFKSIHASDEYPHLSLGENGVNLPPHTAWDEYSRVLAEVLADLPESVNCLVISLGFDTLATDTETSEGHGFDLTPSDFGQMADKLRATGHPLLVVQEGGYDIPGTVEAARHFIEALTQAGK